MTGPTNQKNSLTFGGDLVQDMDFGSLYHFPQHCGIWDFRKFVSISHTVTGRFSRNDWHREDNESSKLWQKSDRHPERSPIRKSGFEFRITFGWGQTPWQRFTQSSFTTFIDNREYEPLVRRCRCRASRACAQWSEFLPLWRCDESGKPEPLCYFLRTNHISNRQNKAESCDCCYLSVCHSNRLVTLRAG